jgi:hypothetical protein
VENHFLERNRLASPPKIDTSLLLDARACYLPVTDFPVAESKSFLSCWTIVALFFFGLRLDAYRL